MMSFNALSRSALRAAKSTSVARIAPASRNYVVPSLVAMENKKLDAEYEKHRVEVENPAQAMIDPEIVIEYPKTWDPKDIGHTTTGSGHGKHTKRTLSSFSMEGKVCIVTGAARGLGNMMARTFVESGASSIVILDLKESEATLAAKELTEWFVEHGQAAPGEISAIGYACDVANESSVQDVFTKIYDKYGRIDMLVTAAGIVENFSALDYPTEKIKKLIDINIMGTYFCAREAAKRMEKGSSIVMIGSMSGSVINHPQPQTPYNFSKAAVCHMGKSMAVEWAPKGIRVNVISPGYVLTNLTKVILDAAPDLRDAWVNGTPMGRLANPDDLKGAVIYLASDASAYTTGSELKVDGGYTCL